MQLVISLSLLTIVVSCEDLQLMVSNLLLHEYCLLEPILCLGANISIDLRIDDSAVLTAIVTASAASSPLTRQTLGCRQHI